MLPVSVMTNSGLFGLAEAVGGIGKVVIVQYEYVSWDWGIPAKKDRPLDDHMQGTSHGNFGPTISFPTCRLLLFPFRPICHNQRQIA